MRIMGALAVGRVILVAALVTVGLTTAPLVVVADDGPPTPPAAYYGNLVTDGEPVPAGVEVTAYVNGERRGSITTTKRGQYGGESATERKLVVEGDDGDDGATVTFRVNGEPTNATIAWHSGDVSKVDLAVGERADAPDGRDGAGNGSDGDTDDAAGNGGSDAAGSDDGTDDADGGGSRPAEIAANVSATDDGLVVAVSGVSAGTTVDAEFPPSLESSGVAVRALSMSFDGDVGDVGLEATVRDVGAVAVEAVESAAPFAYLQLEPDGFGDAAVDGATVEFSVARSALPGGLSPEDVALFRLADGEWQELPTVHHGNGTYTAVTPGFSTFAVAGYEANVRVATATLDADRVDAGEQFEVRAIVQNRGKTDGMTVVTLTADGEILDSRELVVPADGTRRVTFTPSIGETGTYDVGVADADAGRLVVEAAERADGSDQRDDQGAVGAQDGEGSSGGPFGLDVNHLVALLAALLIVSGVAVIRPE